MFQWDWTFVHCSFRSPTSFRPSFWPAPQMRWLQHCNRAPSRSHRRLDLTIEPQWSKSTSAQPNSLAQIWWPLVEYAALVFLSKALKAGKAWLWFCVTFPNFQNKTGWTTCRPASALGARFQSFSARKPNLWSTSRFSKLRCLAQCWSVEWVSTNWWTVLRYIEIADNTFAHLHNLSLDWHLRKKMGSHCHVSCRHCLSKKPPVTGTWSVPWIEVSRPPVKAPWYTNANIYYNDFNNLKKAILVKLPSRNICIISLCFWIVWCLMSENPEAERYSPFCF